MSTPPPPSELPDYLQELARLFGQYDDDTDFESRWPEIEGQASATLQQKITELRKRDTTTHPSSMNPVPSLVSGQWETQFFRTVKHYQIERLQTTEEPPTSLSVAAATKTGNPTTSDSPTARRQRPSRKAALLPTSSKSTKISHVLLQPPMKEPVDKSFSIVRGRRGKSLPGTTTENQNSDDSKSGGTHDPSMNKGTAAPTRKSTRDTKRARSSLAVDTSPEEDDVANDQRRTSKKRNLGTKGSQGDAVTKLPARDNDKDSNPTRKTEKKNVQEKGATQQGMILDTTDIETRVRPGDRGYRKTISTQGKRDNAARSVPPGKVGKVENGHWDDGSEEDFDDYDDDAEQDDEDYEDGNNDDQDDEDDEISEGYVATTRDDVDASHDNNDLNGDVSEDDDDDVSADTDGDDNLDPDWVKWKSSHQEVVMDNRNLKPHQYELAYLMGRNANVFDWKEIEYRASRKLKKAFRIQRKRILSFDKNRLNYLVRPPQMARFKHVRSIVIKSFKEAPIPSGPNSQFWREKKYSMLWRIKLGTDVVDESALRDEERELVRLLVAQDPLQPIDWSLIERDATPLLKSLIESKKNHVDFANDPLQCLVGPDNVDVFQKVRESLAKVLVADAEETLDLSSIPGIQKWTPLQIEFARLVAEAGLGKENRPAQNLRFDWQYLFAFASPALQKEMDDKANEFSSFFKSPTRYICKYEQKVQKEYLALIHKMGPLIDKDKVLAKRSRIDIKPTLGPRLPPEEVKEFGLPSIFVEFGHILEDIKEKNPDHHYDTIYDWDYIDSVASAPLLEHLKVKRAMKTFERSKMNSIVGRDRNLLMRQLRMKIRRFRGNELRPRGFGLCTAWQNARNLDPTVDVSTAGKAEIMADLDAFFLDGSTKLCEPEKQLARILEDIKFQQPGVSEAAIWDMDYILSHAPGRLKRHLTRKMNANAGWRKHPRKVFVKMSRFKDFDEVRKVIRSLLKDGKITPFPIQTYLIAQKNPSSRKSIGKSSSHNSRQSLTSLDPSSSNRAAINRPGQEASLSVPNANNLESARGDAAVDFTKKAPLESIPSRNQFEHGTGSDSEASFTDQEEQVTLLSTRRTIKMTSTLKELAIKWELLNPTGPTQNPDWNLFLEHVSPPLKRLILEKQKFRSFRNDPVLLLVPPDLRGRFEQLRNEVRRFPEYYTTQLSNLFQKHNAVERTQREGLPGPKRDRGQKDEDGKSRTDDDPIETDKEDSIVQGNDCPQVVVAKKTLSQEQMVELAQLMTKAQRNGKGWSYIERRVSPDLMHVISEACKQPNFLDSPAQCIVPNHMWADFTKLRQLSNARDNDSDDSYYDDSKIAAWDMMEEQRRRLDSFSKDIREGLSKFEEELGSLFKSDVNKRKR